MIAGLNKIIILFLILSSFEEVLSQGQSDIDKILGTAFVSNSVKFNLEKIDQLSNLDYNVPLIEKVELRSETNGFDFKKQDYAIRVSPNSKSSRRAHRQFHESVRFMTKMEYTIELMKSLSERYHLIKDYVFANEMLRIEKIRNVVALDKVKLLKKMISLSSFDIVELIEAEDEINRLQRKIQSINNTIENFKMQISELISQDDIQIERGDIISVHKIKTLMLGSLIEIENSHPEAEVLSAKHYNASMEYEWEASKNNFSIGFLQAKYGHDPNDPFRNNFSLGFGFDFPIKGSSGLELNEIKVNILDAQSKYLATKDQIERDKQRSKSKLKSLISIYDLLSKQIEEGNANHALSEYSRQGVASPRALLKLKELTVSNEALLIELQAEIITSYIDYIYRTGLMASNPYTNYIHEELSLLK